MRCKIKILLLKSEFTEKLVSNTIEYSGTWNYSYNIWPLLAEAGYMNDFNDSQNRMIHLRSNLIARWRNINSSRAARLWLSYLDVQHGRQDIPKLQGFHVIHML